MTPVTLAALWEGPCSFGPCSMAADGDGTQLQSQPSKEKSSKHPHSGVLEGEASQGLESASPGHAPPPSTCVKPRA